MSHTVLRVNRRDHDIIGTRTTVTDVTVTADGEVVTAASLGLTVVQSARADTQTGVATDTGVYTRATVSSSGSTVTLTSFTAAGVASTVATGTVIRVTATGT
jgi:hypothetical protein